MAVLGTGILNNPFKQKNSCTGAHRVVEADIGPAARTLASSTYFGTSHKKAPEDPF